MTIHYCGVCGKDITEDYTKNKEAYINTPMNNCVACRQNNAITLDDILKSDVYNEEFLTAFHAMLEKFVEEYDDMQYMTAIRQAKKLLDTINQ